MFSKSNICVIPELGLGCFGCCGHNFINKKKVLDDIHKNNLELKNLSFNNISVISACWRRKELKSSGICPNIISETNSKGTMFLCGVHPLRTNCKDPRENYCDTNFLCRLAYHFNNMNDKEKKRLFDFIKHKVNQGISSYEYSIMNSKDELWNEFVKNS